MIYYYLLFYVCIPAGVNEIEICQKDTIWKHEQKRGLIQFCLFASILGLSIICGSLYLGRNREDSKKLLSDR